MKILHITNAFPTQEYSSYGIFIKEQIDSLEKEGLTQKYFFVNARKYGAIKYFKIILELRKNIKKFCPQIIHVHHEFCLIPLIFISKKQPIVLSLLGDIQKRGLINKVLYKILSLRVDKIIMKNKISRNSKIVYLPNGVNTELFKPIDIVEAKQKLGLNIQTKYVLFVSASKNNPIKRYDKYSEIVSNLNERYGNTEELLMTNVTREQTPYYFNAAEFLLLTSDHEGSPNAVKEAMACNKPVVSTNVGNVCQLLTGSVNSYVASTNSINELVEASINVLHSNKELNNRDLIFKQDLDIQNVAKKLIELYKKLVNEK